MSTRPDAFSGETDNENRPTDSGATGSTGDQEAVSSLPQASAEVGEEEQAPIEIIAESSAAPSEPVERTPWQSASPDIRLGEEPLFAQYEYVPAPPPPRRKPDLWDFLLFIVLGIGAFFCSGLLMMVAIHFHLFGVSTFKQANEEIHYRIGSQVVWYLITLLFCSIVFRMAWRKSFFAGLEWRAGAATDRIGRLIGAASACFVAAIVDELVIPGPTNAPIDQTFRIPGAVWLLFGFGVTLAPLMEEITFRGLLLPALCTAYDWTKERFTGAPRLALDENGFPHWSRPAMMVGSVLVSIPFALMHGEQTAYSIGPFLLLVGISLVLCWVRLAVRSLAASVIVHSSYNLLLFLLMFLGTGGFRHLDKM